MAVVALPPFLACCLYHAAPAGSRDAREASHRHPLLTPVFLHQLTLSSMPVRSYSTTLACGRLIPRPVVGSAGWLRPRGGGGAAVGFTLPAAVVLGYAVRLARDQLVAPNPR
jgi:hypothetical protein